MIKSLFFFFLNVAWLPDNDKGIETSDYECTT